MDGVAAVGGGERVLVVGDESAVCDNVVAYLARVGFQVRCGAGGDSVETVVDEFQPALVILDVSPAIRPGFELLRELRHGSHVPVIVVSARADETDRVVAFELGADDYLVKPFSPRELSARVRSVLRRATPKTRLTTLTRPPPSESVFHGLRINTASREVMVNGEVVALTVKEFDLLGFLVAHPRQVLSRAQLLNAVWETDPADQDPAKVTVHIRRLRTKIERDPRNPRWITTAFGAGYRFEP